MKLYSLVIDDKLIAEVDKLIRKYGLYSSRSDFIRDAIRTRLLEIKRFVGEEAETGEEESEAAEGAVESAMEELKRQQDEKKFTGVH